MITTNTTEDLLDNAFGDAEKKYAAKKLFYKLIQLPEEPQREVLKTVIKSFPSLSSKQQQKRFNDFIDVLKRKRKTHILQNVIKACVEISIRTETINDQEKIVGYSTDEIDPFSHYLFNFFDNNSSFNRDFDKALLEIPYSTSVFSGTSGRNHFIVASSLKRIEATFGREMALGIVHRDCLNMMLGMINFHTYSDNCLKMTWDEMFQLANTINTHPYYHYASSTIANNDWKALFEQKVHLEEHYQDVVKLLASKEGADIKVKMTGPAINWTRYDSENYTHLHNIYLMTFLSAKSYLFEDKWKLIFESLLVKRLKENKARYYFPAMVYAVKNQLLETKFAALLNPETSFFHLTSYKRFFQGLRRHCDFSYRNVRNTGFVCIDDVDFEYIVSLEEKFKNTHLKILGSPSFDYNAKLKYLDDLKDSTHYLGMVG